ncbi:MAG: DUF3168 domain-containing protein [Planctomycetes bacterium]|nr:DUF3168 domain-containing protein [Planctomycetota bacterium]
MSAEWEVQVAVLAALDGNVNAPVFDNVPENQAAPYIVIGDDTSTPHDADLQTGFDMTLTIHSWSTYRGKKEVKALMGEVYNLLNRAPLAVTGYTVIDIMSEYGQTFLDSDGVTRHGVQRFRILLTTN